MSFHLDNSDMVTIIALALLTSLILIFRARQLTVFGVLLRAVIADIIAIAAVLGLQMLPTWFPG